MAKQGACDRSNRSGRAYESANECAFQPLGETVPLFVIGPYEDAGSASGEYFLLAGSQAGGADLCAGGADGGPIRDRVVWRAEGAS